MIQQIVRDIVAGLTISGSSPESAPTFLFGWKGQLNLRLDEVQNEIVWLIPSFSNSQLAGNLMIDKYSVVIGFFGKSELDWFGEQHEPVIDRQRAQCAKFIYAAQQSDILKEVSDFIITDEVNAFDVNLSGVTLQCKMTPLKGFAVC